MVKICKRGAGLYKRRRKGAVNDGTRRVKTRGNIKMSDVASPVRSAAGSGAACSEPEEQTDRLTDWLMLAVIGHNRKTGSDGETDTLDVHLWAVTKRICSSLCVCVYSTVLEETDVWREKNWIQVCDQREKDLGFFFLHKWLRLYCDEDMSVCTFPSQTKHKHWN